MGRFLLALVMLAAGPALAQNAPNAPQPDALDPNYLAEQITVLQDQVQGLQQQLEETGQRVDQIEAAVNQNGQVLDQAVQRQQDAGRLQQNRVARERSIDALLQQAAQIDLALMGGNRDIEPALNALAQATVQLRSNSADESGRLETDQWSDALAALDGAQEALRAGDLYLVRSYVSGFASGIATARNAASANSQRAWAP